MPSFLYALVQEVVQELEPRARAKGVSLRLELTPRLTAEANRFDLRQILQRLMESALDAVPSGGWIRVAAQPERDRTLIAIKDSGNGLPRETAWVAKAAWRNRGEYWSNRMEGKGSTHYLSLPRLDFIPPTQKRQQN